MLNVEPSFVHHWQAYGDVVGGGAGLRRPGIDGSDRHARHSAR